MVYEDWPTHEASAKVGVRDAKKLARIVTTATQYVDARVTMRADNGGGAVMEHMNLFGMLLGGMQAAGMAAAGCVDIEARGPDAVMVVAALREALQGKKHSTWLKRVQRINSDNGPALAPYTVVTERAWFGLFEDYYP